jgi:hypothetical protein
MACMNGHSWRWWTIRAELAIATAAPLLLAFVAFAGPAWHRRMLGVPPPIDPQDLAFILGFALSLVGAAWAWRIWRADLEAGTPPWRYRDRT